MDKSLGKVSRDSSVLHAGVYLADTFLLLVCLFVNYLRVSVCACEKKDRQVTTANLQHHAAQRYNKTARQRDSDTEIQILD